MGVIMVWGAFYCSHAAPRNGYTLHCLASLIPLDSFYVSVTDAGAAGDLEH